jgi:membrane-associated phospholipid phosphatase
VQLDENLFRLINQTWACPPIDKLMAIMSSFAFWIPIFLFIAVAILIFCGKKGRQLVLSLVIVIGLTEAIFVGSIKGLIHRPRPPEVLVNTRIVALQKANPQTLALFKPATVGHSAAKDIRSVGKSFPSGHVTDNFAALTVLIAFFGWRGALYLLPASLVAYSRIYVGKHWPSDVLASIFLGVLCALLILGLIDWSRRRLTLLRPRKSIMP